MWLATIKIGMSLGWVCRWGVFVCGVGFRWGGGFVVGRVCLGWVCRGVGCRGVGLSGDDLPWAGFVWCGFVVGWVDVV